MYPPPVSKRVCQLSKAAEVQIFWVHDRYLSTWIKNILTFTGGIFCGGVARGRKRNLWQVWPHCSQCTKCAECTKCTWIVPSGPPGGGGTLCGGGSCWDGFAWCRNCIPGQTLTTPFKMCRRGKNASHIRCATAKPKASSKKNQQGKISLLRSSRKTNEVNEAELQLRAMHSTRNEYKIQNTKYRRSGGSIWQCASSRRMVDGVRSLEHTGRTRYIPLQSEPMHTQANTWC